MTQSDDARARELLTDRCFRFMNTTEKEYATKSLLTAAFAEVRREQAERDARLCRELFEFWRTTEASDAEAGAIEALLGGLGAAIIASECGERVPGGGPDGDGTVRYP